ncbi:MAG: hypothetical protein ACI30V_07290 [Muribaculaceae bacterium]
MLEIRHHFKEVILLARIALKSKHLKRPATAAPLHIAMVDGESFHGGMCDRFKGMISLYAYCKQHGVPFKIRHTFPFHLEDYLQPAACDWVLHDGEYTDNPLYCRVLYMRGEHYAKRLLRLKAKRQIHFYTNRDLLPRINEARSANHLDAYDWGELFRELFRPGEELQSRIEEVTRAIGGEYDAAVFRFQNLLGDFKEYHFKAIADKAEAELLIEKCVDSVAQLRDASPCKRLLVTSDSVTFLSRVSQLNGVHIVPGSLSHMDGAKLNADTTKKFEVYLKSFVDFYMISQAQTVYRVGTPQMYESEFPVYAAKVNNRPFKTLTI